MKYSGSIKRIQKTTTSKPTSVYNHPIVMYHTK